MLIWWFGVSMILFTLLARLSPNIAGQNPWRKTMLTDAVYWFAGPVLYGAVFQVLVIVGVAVMFGNDPQIINNFLKGGNPLVADLPIWLQVLMVLLISDFLQYWVHRWFHESRMWRFHAIHHSSPQLDWLSASRFHPVNFILYSTITGAVTVLMGFAPAVFILLGPFNILYSGMVHANLNWTFGPLKYVLASPVFHRWHHTGVDEGGDRNFAPTFPFIDLMFGTFYMPQGKQPERFGVFDDPVPEHFLGQMAYPFKKKS